MRPTILDIDVMTVDAESVCNAFTVEAAGAIEIEGADATGGVWTAPDGLGHQISLVESGTKDNENATVTYTGTDADGKAQVEIITDIESGGTELTTKFFKTISSIEWADVETLDPILTIGTNGKPYVKVKITLNSNSNQSLTPTVYDWYLQYQCRDLR